MKNLNAIHQSPQEKLVQSSANSAELLGTANETLKSIEQNTMPKDVQKIQIEQPNRDVANAFFSMLKGDKGDTPSAEELTPLIQSLIPAPIPGRDGINGIKGDKGVKGDKGDKPILGVDYQLPKDGINGTNGKDGSPDTGEQIVEKLNPLKNVLDFQILTNIPDFVLHRDLSHNTGGGGGGQIITFQEEGVNITTNPITKFNVVGSSGTLTYSGSGVATLTLTDTAVAIGGGVTGGTEGSVLFVSPAGVLAQDNSNFHWYDTSNQLHLGEATGFDDFAGIPLTIGANINNYSGAYFQNLSAGDTASTDLILGANNDNTAIAGHYIDMGVEGSGYLAAATGIIKTVAKNAGGSGYTVGDILTLTAGDGTAQVEVLTLSGSAVNTVSIVSNGTNYTIASSATTGGTGTGCTISVLSLYDYTGLLANDGYFYTAGGNTIIGTDDTVASKSIKFFTGGLATANLRVIIDSTGKTGIGVAVPLSKLHVEGTNNTNGIIIKELATASTRGTYLDFINANNGTSDSGGIIRFYANTSNLVSQISVITGATGATGNLQLQTNNGAGLLQRMFIGQAGNVRIGVATTTPTFLLSLTNAQANTMGIEASLTDVVGRALTVTGGSTVAGTSVNNVAGGNLILSAGLGTGTGASSIVFQTGTTLGSGMTLQTLSTKMTLLGSGVLQIGSDLVQTGTGTVSYGERATDVENQNTYIKSNVGLSADTNGGAYILLQSTTSAGGAVNDGTLNLVAYGQGSSANANAIILSTRSGANAITERFRISSNGNIGISTATFGTNAVGVLGIFNGTAPTTAPADVTQIYSIDTAGAGTAGLAIFAEAAISAAVATASTNKFPIMYNGTTYYVLVTTVA